jgi:predicted transcriptional regulator
MTKKELARLLGVSASIVSRHAKAGMPTDTIERAQKWRKRHLEPARVKGARSNASPNTQPGGDRFPAKNPVR